MTTVNDICDALRSGSPAPTRAHVRSRVAHSGPGERTAAIGVDDAADRRRHPRYPATWRLRLWFGDLGFTDAETANVSSGGLGITLPSRTAASLLRPGRTVGVEVYDVHGPVFLTTAAVRHHRETVGVECADPVPFELFPQRDNV